MRARTITPCRSGRRKTRSEAVVKIRHPAFATAQTTTVSAGCPAPGLSAYTAMYAGVPSYWVSIRRMSVSRGSSTVGAPLRSMQASASSAGAYRWSSPASPVARPEMTSAASLASEEMPSAT